MTTEENFAYFVFINIFPPFVLINGLIGNTFGLIAFAIKKLTNAGPSIINRFLFVSDKIHLVQIIVFYLQYSFLIDLTVISRFTFKLFFYFNYLTCLPLTWLLVCISIEKCISIVSPDAQINTKEASLPIHIHICTVHFQLCVLFIRAS